MRKPFPHPPSSKPRPSRLPLSSRLFSGRPFSSALVTAGLFIVCLFNGCRSDLPEPKTLSQVVANIICPYVTFGADVGILVGISKDGKTTVFSYGETQPGSRQAMGPQSLLEIASLTKPYTALALARMHLAGRLNLDDPVENYLPPE